MQMPEPFGSGDHYLGPREVALSLSHYRYGNKPKRAVVVSNEPPVLVTATTGRGRDHFSGTCTSTQVLPGFDVISKVPPTCRTRSSIATRPSPVFFLGRFTSKPRPSSSTSSPISTGVVVSVSFTVFARACFTTF